MSEILMLAAAHGAVPTTPSTRSRVIPWIVVLLLGLGAGPPASAQTGAYTVNGGRADQTGQTYAGTLTDQSAVYVLNDAYLSLTNCTMTKTGDASSIDNSSRCGTNAAVLATSSAVVSIHRGAVTTNASGGNGLFATGSGSTMMMTDGTINASGEGAHGVGATYGGTITLTNVDVTTTGFNASALATDFGGGTVTVNSGTVIAASTVAGSHSAGMYSTGSISASGATITSLADCGGVIDAGGTIDLRNTTLTGALQGIKVWKTASASGTATVGMSGGSLAAVSGDAFYVTDETGNAAKALIYVSGGATISAGTGNILNVVGSSTATFSTIDVDLSGNFHADIPGAATVKLRNSSTLTGAMTGVALTIDAGSVWNVTANSVLTTLVNPDGVSDLSITNIVGNGHDVHYDLWLSLNSYLGGKTYALVNGGTLTPQVVPVQGTSWGAIKKRFQGPRGAGPRARPLAKGHPEQRRNQGETLDRHWSRSAYQKISLRGRDDCFGPPGVRRMATPQASAPVE